PGGALVDAVRSARPVAMIAVAAICVSALALAIWPTFVVVMTARVLHAGASCVLGPVIAALSLGLVGHAALGARLGRNARFASIGNGFAAAVMGASGYLFSNQAVFFLTAALERMGDDFDWSMHRRAATRCCGICAVDRPGGRPVGASTPVVFLLRGLGSTWGSVCLRS